MRMWAHSRVAGGGACWAGCMVGYCLLTGLAPGATLGGSTTLQFDKLKFNVFKMPGLKFKKCKV